MKEQFKVLGFIGLYLALLANVFPDIFPIELRIHGMLTSIAFFQASNSLTPNKHE